MDTVASICVRANPLKTFQTHSRETALNFLISIKVVRVDSVMTFRYYAHKYMNFEPDVSCQDIKLTLKDTKCSWGAHRHILITYDFSLLHENSYSVHIIVKNLNYKLWQPKEQKKKSFQSAKFRAFSLLKIELMFHTILLLFFLIRARWKLSREFSFMHY